MNGMITGMRVRVTRRDERESTFKGRVLAWLMEPGDEGNGMATPVAVVETDYGAVRGCGLNDYNIKVLRAKGKGE